MSRTGVLLINIGTPDAPTPEAVGKYLREFLMDGYVLDMPFFKRWLLVNCVIVPKRKEYSARHYQEIQTEEGSPLLVYTRRFASALAAELADEYVVEIGMRYGNPSIGAALQNLKRHNVDRILALPLYPHFTQSSFETAVVETQRRAQKLGLADKLSFVSPFYVDRHFIDASAELVADHLETQTPDYILFSFHSVPVRHIKRKDTSRSHCLARADCCDVIGPANQNCYRAQCHATTEAIATKLGLQRGSYEMCFQSQLGKDEWIGPALEDLLSELPRRGVRRLAVFCPSFVADCLETLEEIGIRGRDEFKEAGGRELNVIPCLNDDPRWIKAAANIVRASSGVESSAKTAHASAPAPVH
jgi:ferrochelatase